MASYLSFSHLDDLLLAETLGRRSVVAKALRETGLVELGPAVEYHVYRQSADTMLPDLGSLSPTVVTRAILGASRPSDGMMSLDPMDVEIRPIPSDEATLMDVSWVAFQKRLQSAAEAAGFGKRTAASIVGAFCEMVDNAIIHSELPPAMLAGYQRRPNAIAYCVADNGIGVLQSLRKCERYHPLQDHASALRTAVQDGESCLREEGAHGLGFRQLIRSLAGLSGSVRLRSGDFSLELDGTSLTFVDATLAQRASLQGFVASVVCRPE